MELSYQRSDASLWVETETQAGIIRRLPGRALHPHLGLVPGIEAARAAALEIVDIAGDDG